MTTVQDPYKMRPATPPHDDGLLQQKPMQQSNASRVRPMRTDIHSDMHTDISQSNDPTTVVSSHLQSLIYWERPARSLVALTTSLVAIYLTRQYSLLQIGAAALTISTGVNLAYVLLSMNAQRIFSDNNEPAVHPHNHRLQRRDPLINKQSVNHYVDLFTEIVETIGKEIKKVVLVQDTGRSLAWFAIAFLVWTFAAHISSRTLIVLSLLGAFTIPRLYQSNKDVVDARISQGNSMVTGHLQRAQSMAYQSATDAYGRARGLAARTGTTGTDAKNTLNKASVVAKEE
ncbi:hypothetical protein NQZ79_g7363 [Umbelopsis isabellina]|nr:hypothetical protein NQZ79_g7363 [Umbelopsis isabellina]